MIIKDLYQNNREFDVFAFTVELFFRYKYNNGKDYDYTKPCYALIGLSDELDERNIYRGLKKHYIKIWDSNEESFTLEDVWDTKQEYERLQKEYEQSQDDKSN